MNSTLRLSRDVPISECAWLERDFRKGELVHRYFGETYNCIGHGGIACTLEPDRTPFFELPAKALRRR